MGADIKEDTGSGGGKKEYKNGQNGDLFYSEQGEDEEGKSDDNSLENEKEVGVQVMD